MGSTHGTGLPNSPPRSATGALAKIRDLEAALKRVRNERATQASAVEQELHRLSEIYGRLRLDYASLEQERDAAVADARTERERRAREALELAERLERAEKHVQLGPRTMEVFVAERMPALPRVREPLPDDRLPELDGFEMLGRLGKGGMAEVYRARRESDGRDVAIKLLRPASASSMARSELFLREAAVMLQLRHPGLVRALDAGECRYGRYLVLEHVEGEPLGRFVRREGPLNERRGIELALEVADALRYCAKADLVHRDVKPSNLLQTVEGRIRICDFGLASLFEDPGMRPYGSPGYAAPEQLVPGVAVDERADIYGLGCTLWHLVVGRRAFPGQPNDAFAEQRELDLVDPRFEGADVSMSFARVIRKMGRRAPEDRYRNWDECVLDLTLVQQGNPAFAAQLSDAFQTVELAAEAASSAPPAAAAPARPVIRIEPNTPGRSSAPLGGVPVVEPLDDDESCTQHPPETPSGVAALPPFPERSVTTDQGSAVILPGPAPEPESPFSRGRWAVLTACLLVAFALGALFDQILGESPAALLERRAHSMVEDGRHADAVESLRSAAVLLSEGQARRLRRLADEIERDLED